MIDALIHLGLFLIEAIIIVAAILIVVAGIFAIAAKGKFKKGTLKIKKLNEHYHDIKQKMSDAILTKKERKRKAKAEKKAAKATKKEEQPDKKRIFVLNFIGDLKASPVESLREEITAILTTATPKDEVFLKLESPGGMVHGYGLAASELKRIKDRGIPLTISVDKVAASGGYMMACIADQILAAPFAIIGSIGVVAQLPNFHRFLKKHNVDFEQITAGEYKRTLTVFGENTDKDREKVQEEVDDIHELFKAFIHTHRPSLDLQKTATGEHWFGTRALELGLIDKLTTSDDYLMEANNTCDLFEVRYKKPKSKLQKLQHAAQGFFN